MSYLEMILPFAIPPAPLAKDLLRELRVPALSCLIGKAKPDTPHHFEDFARQLPHESLLAGHFSPGGGRVIGPPFSNSVGLESAIKSSPANTHNKMQALGVQPMATDVTGTTAVWFTLQPVHIHIARDHLVLTDQRRLTLTEPESRALFAEAKIICDELGKTLVYGDALHWFLRADDWQGLQTATPDAACGHNIDIWMPKGEQARPWRKLQNEIQMQWFSHTINQEREMQGLKPVNSVWLSGGSTQLMDMPDIQKVTEFQQIDLASKRPVLIDALLEPALNNDWASWLERMQLLEEHCFAPALAALRDQQINQLNLIVTDANTLVQFSLTPWSLRQFWRKPTLHPLFSLPAQETSN
ncbi:hypothetical protein AAKU64_001022 [Undibacterium sp. GrIS 1.8]|uniref:hypothetical protein n=1 Tax=unclassified Undibacterium TaxID=2630295 RepID=UPI0033933ECF